MAYCHQQYPENVKASSLLGVILSIVVDLQERFHESAWQNLVLNQDRLVSHLDLHHGLR